MTIFYKKAGDTMTSLPHPDPAKRYEKAQNRLKNELDKLMKKMKAREGKFAFFTGGVMSAKTPSEAFRNKVRFDTLPNEDQWHYGLCALSMMEGEEFLQALTLVMSRRQMLPNAKDLKDGDQGHDYFNALLSYMDALDEDSFDENDSFVMAAGSRCIGYDREYDMLVVVQYHDQLPKLDCVTAFVGDHDAACNHHGAYYTALYNLLGTMREADGLNSKAENVINAALYDVEQRLDALNPAPTAALPGLRKLAHQ